MDKYYDSETIEVTIKLKVSWAKHIESSKKYALEQAMDIFVGSKSGCHVDHGCYRVEPVKNILDTTSHP